MKTKLKLKGKRSFNIKIRDFNVRTDLPEEKKGDNTGPTPSELFMASLGACIALYCVSYLDTAGLDSSGFSIDMDWDFSKDRPSRIAQASLSIKVPNADLGSRKKALLTAAKQCTIHNTLENPPKIMINLDSK